MAIRWAFVDPVWYRKAYAAEIAAAGLTDDNEIIQHYLSAGRIEGKSPNALFDEGWFVGRYPDVAALIRDGKVVSGFDHYRQNEFLKKSPHWLFSEAGFRRHIGDPAGDALRAEGYVNGYDRFLDPARGNGKGGSHFFDPDVYLQNLPESEQAAASRLGAFRHYLETGIFLHPEIRTSWYFDPVWYAETYPEAARLVEAGEYRNCLHHYLTVENACDFDPLPWFSETFYLTRHDDIADAVKRKQYRRAYEHFVEFGAAEMRVPREGVSLAKYATVEVLDDIKAGTAANAFAHFLMNDPKFDDEREVVLSPSEAQTKALFLKFAKMMLPLYRTTPIDFTVSGKPQVSVIMVGFNQIAMTLQTLASLRQNFHGAIELIFVDAGSTDDTVSIGNYVRGAKIIRFETNIGFVLACNAGLDEATAPVTLYLNNDVRLQFGAVERAMRRLASEPGIGAVGSRIIRTNGQLQEAGSILWRDGSALGYMRDAPSDAPEANFVRDVDFCSACFLLAKTSVLQDLGGFDADYAPAYYEDVDLCLRIRLAGLRIVYDPSVVIEHLEYGTSSKTRNGLLLMSRNRKVLQAKHNRTLRYQPVKNDRKLAAARARNASRGRVLMFEDYLPMKQIGSGFGRSNDIVHTMVELGYQVTVFPKLPMIYNPGAITAEFPDTVEVMHNLTLGDFEAFLQSRPGYFDHIWVSRTHNAGLLKPILEANADILPTDGYVLDTEAIAAARMVEMNRIFGREETIPFEDEVSLELKEAEFFQRVVAVTAAEAALISNAGHAGATVIGHRRKLAMTSRKFEDRRDILFVGSFHLTDSPNADSVEWFANEVWPYLEVLLPEDVKFRAVGFMARGLGKLKLPANPRIIMAGPREDLMPVYDQHRIFVAPTRFAAGIPYKAHEAASFGIPMVVTDLLRKQLGWRGEEDVLTADAADPERFAEQVARLYLDPDLWQRVRENAARRIAVENSAEAYAKAVGEVLAGSVSAGAAMPPAPMLALAAPKSPAWLMEPGLTGAALDDEMEPEETVVQPID